MRRQTKRAWQLYIASVITAAVLITLLYFAIAITGFEKSKGASLPEAPRQEIVSRPQRCAKYLVEYTEDQWDPVTETYPDNPEWMRCMGVERRS